MAEIATGHYFIQYKSPFMFIWTAYKILAFEFENVLQYPHDCRSKTHHAKFSKKTFYL